jgi:transcriptional regulator with XRE-family HTH domain
MSKTDICKKIGITKNTLLRYERGDTHPNKKILGQIADELQIHITQLYDDWYKKR